MAVSDQYEGLRKQSKEANKEDRDRATLFEVLVATPGWKAYVEMLERSMQAEADKILQPAGSVDRMIELEYVKGALSGLVRARDLPSVTIAAAKELRQSELEDV
jgi:hypothetical protein